MATFDGTSGPDTLTGTPEPDTLNGYDGNDRLDGAGGADTMVGGLGADTYIVDDMGDAAIEYAGEGIDRVLSSVSFTLGDYVERLILTGLGTIDGTGNALNNLIVGNSAFNVLDGRGGADDMRGGNGNDWYMVDNAGDLVTELAGEGDDTIFTSLATFSIAAIGNVEDLVGDRRPVTYDPNAPPPVDQQLEGNALANYIDGGQGADRMTGGLGDDSYSVDNLGDTIVELSGGGTDSVRAQINWRLGPNVENLILITDADFGIYAANGTGNALDNRIEGNDLNNVLNGGLGADTLIGGTGNDTYIIDNAGDVIVEASFPGVPDRDCVRSFISYALPAQLEQLILVGTAAIRGIGNAAANTITGNAEANLLYGAGGSDSLSGVGGNDRLNGGLGNDRLNGGDGADQFVFNSALDGSNNVDTIVGFSVADDTIVLSTAVFGALTARGTLAASAFRTGSSAQDADDRIIYNSATGNIYYDPDGTGAEQQVLFAHIAAATALTNADFLIGP